MSRSNWKGPFIEYKPFQLYLDRSFESGTVETYITKTAFIFSKVLSLKSSINKKELLSRLLEARNKDHKKKELKICAKNWKVWSRRSHIPSFLIGKCVFVHTGKDFKKYWVKKEKIQYKFGQFARSKKIAVFKPKAKKKK